MDKLTDQINVRLSHSMEQQIVALAAIEDKSPGQYVRELIADHLQAKRRQFEKMQEAFGPVNTDNLDNRQ